MQYATKPPFLPGDPVPDFACRSSNNPLFHFDTAGGRYLVLSFFGSADNPHSRAVLSHLYSNTELFDDANLSFFGVSIDKRDEARVHQRIPGYRLFWDFDAQISKRYGAWLNTDKDATEHFQYRPFTLVLDPLMRVIANIPIQPAQAHNAELDKVLSCLPALERYAGPKMHAPVLLLPRVFEPEFCRELISAYQKNGGTESGFMREKDGKTIGVYDDSFKKRQDYMVQAKELLDGIRYRIARRLLPEIHKAFAFEVTRMERYLVACYDAETGGYFKTHRDNTTKGTAHRRFAVTINLNAEEFEGGELRFPEFGTATYRAPTGGAVVFSCSLLHEATPVTKGTRYAFLPFLYNDAAAAIRDQNREYLTGEHIRVG